MRIFKIIAKHIWYYSLFGYYINQPKLSNWVEYKKYRNYQNSQVIQVSKLTITSSTYQKYKTIAKSNLYKLVNHRNC